MTTWENTKYYNWYKSHRRFSFTAKHCIELYETNKCIPDSIFKPFIKTLYCHSKSEEKMFKDTSIGDKIVNEHSHIIPTKQYTNDEKYHLCKSLITHMKEEETVLYSRIIQNGFDNQF